MPTGALAKSTDYGESCDVLPTKALVIMCNGCPIKMVGRRC